MRVDCCNCSLYPRLCIASFISCVFGVIAFVSPSWTEGPYGDFEYLQTGLLLFCHHRNDNPGNRMCAPLIFGQQEVWFEAVRLMSMLSWILLFTVFVMSILLHYQDSAHTYSLTLVVMGLLSGAMGVVGMFLYAIPWTVEGVLKKYDVTLSWGYIIYVIWHVLTLTAFIVICVLGKDIWRSQFKLRRRHT